MLFRDLPAVRPDPILSLSAAFERDEDPRKIDLGIGVYKDEAGRAPVLASVKRAEAWLLASQATKAYLSSAGHAGFNERMEQLLFGVRGAAVTDGRVRCIQTPGGSGALRVAAEFVRLSRPGATVWVPRPTWANHVPILRAAGVEVGEYQYYEREGARLTFDAMLETLRRAAPDDLVLLHGCCHNPCGADLNAEQWRELAHVLLARGVLPLIDIAYQGFARGIEEDAAGLRLLADSVPEMLVASSCSKSFSLYRERTGAIAVVAATRTEADRAAGAILEVIRALYSMPPDHGAAVVAYILGSPELRAQWDAELRAMRHRLHTIRTQFAAQLTEAAGVDFAWIARQNGMFSFLDLTPRQVERLRAQFHIHALASGRINLAGLSAANTGRAAAAVAAIMSERAG